MTAVSARPPWKSSMIDMRARYCVIANEYWETRPMPKMLYRKHFSMRTADSRLFAIRPDIRVGSIGSRPMCASAPLGDVSGQIKRCGKSRTSRNPRITMQADCSLLGNFSKTLSIYWMNAISKSSSATTSAAWIRAKSPSHSEFLAAPLPSDSGSCAIAWRRCGPKELRHD